MNDVYETQKEMSAPIEDYLEDCGDDFEDAEAPETEDDESENEDQEDEE